MKMMSNIFINMLRYLLLILSIAPSCFMEGDFVESDISGSSSSTPSLSLPFEAIQIVGPRDFQALSGDLVVWTRLSPLVFNLTGTLDETLSLLSLSMQLLILNKQDATETLLTTQTIPSPITTAWEKVNFDCNVVVQGGLYSLRVVQDMTTEPEENSIDTDYNLQILSNITISISYPTIVLDVPHRIEAYTTSTPISFGFTRSTACEPKLPLPSSLLVLSICTQNGAEIKTDLSKQCKRDFATVFKDPLHSLQKEGRITISVECHLWARNATYRVQLRELPSHRVIAKSQPIRVEWGSQFSINMSKPTVMPCRGSIRAIVSHPSCILPGKDKIRIYGHETLSVPSLLVPNRLSYIGEQQIRPNNRVVTFRCNLFPQRFLRFCFQYINTAVDDSVAVVMEKCIPTNPPLENAGWSSWSHWSPCTVTCGSDGRQFHYRFCDNPPPSSGANFCKGDAVEERTCDSLPDCPPQSPMYIDTSGESLTPPESSTMIATHRHQHRHNTLKLENITITPGCDCGCILYDLVPGRNETLVIFISSNHSSPCADEDEVDHHKFKWIFHAKDERDLVRLEVVEMEVQCVTITFRDGNTTDSNLLRVITSQQEQTHYDELLSQNLLWTDEGDEDLYEPLTLQSTGASLSITSVPDSNKNCTGQFIYFIAYYSTLPSSNASLPIPEPNGEPVVAMMSYEFWIFLVLKIILLFFVVVVILSGFGGCMTKVYRKGKYKELKCFDNEDEGANLDRTSNPGGEDDTSRCTSVTLMSFDYSYWRRHWSTIKAADEWPLQRKADEQGADGAKSRKNKSIYSPEDPLRSRSRTPQSVGSTSISMSMSNSVGSEANSISISTHSNSMAEKWTRHNEKLRKETENLKRRASVDKEKNKNDKDSKKIIKKEQEEYLKEEGGERRKYCKRKIPCNLTNKAEYEKLRLGELTTSLLKKRDIGKSQVSMLTNQSFRFSSCGEDESRVASRTEFQDGDQDFEMDYYDYDVMNVGTIPGSYLGLEPAFVLWNSEVYQHNQNEDEHQREDHLIMPTTSSSNASNNTSSHEEEYCECDIEMTAATAGSSSNSGIFSDPHFTKKKQITIRETSLDTLKFADDESDIEDSATQASSDSIFDNNDHDLINENDSKSNIITS